MGTDATPAVCVVGVWHQGAVAAACLSDLGYSVTGVDIDAGLVERLGQGSAAVFEPGLDDLIARGRRSGTLTFTTDVREGVRGAQVVWLAFDTPVDEQDQSDLTGIFATARSMAPALERDVIVLVTCQVPVGTCEQLEAEIKDAAPAAEFEMVYSPENLRLGQAIELFRNPPLLVLGSRSERALQRINAFLAPLKGPRVFTSVRTAEMTKHALNAYLALSVSFANELGKLCDELEADGVQIAEALRKEPRVGPKAMLFPGLGFSGGTLARDVTTLRRLGDELGLETPLLDAVWEVNEEQNRAIVRNIRRMCGDLRGLRVGILGLTYKPGTSTLRRSIALEIVRSLASDGASVFGYDPKADRSELARVRELQVVDDPYDAAARADALVLATPWPEFKVLDFQRIKAQMANPRLIDANNMLDASAIRGLGFLYVGTGRGSASNGLRSQEA